MEQIAGGCLTAAPRSCARWKAHSPFSYSGRETRRLCPPSHCLQLLRNPRATKGVEIALGEHSVAPRVYLFLQRKRVGREHLHQPTRRGPRFIEALETDERAD